jgi:hypothetical protein
MGYWQYFYTTKTLFFIVIEMKKIVFVLITLAALFLVLGCTQSVVFSDNLMTKDLVNRNITKAQEQFAKMAEQSAGQVKISESITDAVQRNKRVLSSIIWQRSAEVVVEDFNFYASIFGNNSAQDDYTTNTAFLTAFNTELRLSGPTIARLSALAMDLNGYTGDSPEAEFGLKNSIILEQIKGYSTHNIQLDSNYFVKNLDLINPQIYGLGGKFSDEFRQNAAKKTIPYLNSYIKYKQEKLTESIAAGDITKILIHGYMLQQIEKSYS